MGVALSKGETAPRGGSRVATTPHKGSLLHRGQFSLDPKNNGENPIHRGPVELRNAGRSTRASCSHSRAGTLLLAELPGSLCPLPAGHVLATPRPLTHGFLLQENLLLPFSWQQFPLTSLPCGVCIPGTITTPLSCFVPSSPLLLVTNMIITSEIFVQKW